MRRSRPWMVCPPGNMDMALDERWLGPNVMRAATKTGDPILMVGQLVNLVDCQGTKAK